MKCTELRLSITKKNKDYLPVLYCDLRRQIQIVKLGDVE